MCAACGVAQVIEVLFILVIQLLMLGVNLIVSMIDYGLSLGDKRK